MNTDPRWPNRYWGTADLPKNKSSFFTASVGASAEGSGSVATIRMYGPIDSWGGWWGISAKDVGMLLDALPSEVTQIILRINSPGGEAFEGLAILNMLRAHRASVTAVVDGMAASAASFIAAGCDEAVMSPGTMMMIHAPSSIAWGTANDMRETAEFLDLLETSITEIYEGKAGAKDWHELMSKDTWLTTAAAIELGLADRIAVIPDAGEASTTGIDIDALLDALDPDNDDEPFDAAAASPVARAIPAALTPIGVQSVAPDPPRASAPGTPNREESAVNDSEFQAGLRERLGVTDTAASPEMLFAALDEALAERADTPPIPENVVQVDRGAYATLQQQAAEGAAARAEQIGARRDRLVTDALEDGRIAPATRDAWRAQLDTNEDGTTSLLASLPKNAALPTTAIGVSDEVNSAESAMYARAFPTEKKEA